MLARNQDDHVKNVAFLMDKSGRWRLAPAHDAEEAGVPPERAEAVGAAHRSL